MNFTKGFEKVAINWGRIGEDTRSVGRGILTAAKGVASGAKESMGSTVGDALSLKGLSHVGKAAKEHGLSGLKTKAGQEGWGKAIGKAAPSLAAGGAYGVGLKKVYDKATGPSGGQGQYYY